MNMLYNTDPLKLEVEIRNQPLFNLHSTVLSSIRTNRPNSGAQNNKTLENEIMKKDRCFFEKEILSKQIF